MKFEYLRPEALKKEFRETYKEVEELLSSLVLPYQDKASQKEANSTKTLPQKQWNLFDGQTFINFLGLAQAKKILEMIKSSGGGVTEETYDAALWTIFELECQLNQLTIILQVQKIVDHSDPLLIELISAYTQIRVRINNLINMAANQMDGYDKFHHYDDEIKRWKNSIKDTVEQLSQL